MMLPRVFLLAGATTLVACTGTITAEDGTPGAPAETGATGTWPRGPATAATPGPEGAGAPATSPPGAGGATGGGGPASPEPPGACRGDVPAPVRIWRLTATQYDNTLAAVLGDRTRPGQRFIVGAPADDPVVLHRSFEAMAHGRMARKPGWT